MPPVEKWKRIKDHPNYQVSDQGRIRNVLTGNVLTNTKTGNGYEKVNVSEKGRTITKRVNRLVAIAFLGEPKGDKVYCHHINHEPADNRVENLQWVTPKQNSDAHVEYYGKQYRVAIDHSESAAELFKNLCQEQQEIKQKQGEILKILKKIKEDCCNE